jgi:hypothetical protein
MTRRLSWTLALVLAATAARAQDKLAWKFKEGDKFYAETISKAKHLIKANGADLKLNLTMTFVNRYTVTEVGR